MPDVTVRNDTPNNLNVAFRFVAPKNWTNALTPGASWITHLESIPHTIEVRIDNENNRFSAENSWGVAFDISRGWLAGAASVTLGALSLGNVIPSAPAIPGAAFLMKQAIQAGGRFAQNADGMVISVGNVWIPFENKTYILRFDENSGYSLWDADQNIKL